MIIHRSIVTEELALTAPTGLRPCKKKGEKKKKDESVAPIKNNKKKHTGTQS